MPRIFGDDGLIRYERAQRRLRADYGLPMPGQPDLTRLSERLAQSGLKEGAPVLALDPHGAPLQGKVIFSTDGSMTRELVGDPRSPLRNFVCALVDEDEAADTDTQNSKP